MDWAPQTQLWPSSQKGQQSECQITTFWIDLSNWHMLQLSSNMISEKQDYIRTSRAVIEFLLFYKHSNIVQKKIPIQFYTARGQAVTNFTPYNRAHTNRSVTHFLTTIMERQYHHHRGTLFT
jgi:hypothetical protein